MLKEIELNLKKHLSEAFPEHNFKDVLDYAVLPAGKLFRPQLVYSFANDLGELTESHKTLASSIEIHHAYTLVHDDLPAMDDDDMRRGKASTHKKFSEWEAILAGDALLNFSFELLAQIEPKFLPELLKLYGKTTGPRGLILGQVKDLENSHKELKDVLEIHTLKTSRLIQLALQGSNLLSGSKIDKTKVMSLGESLGIVFQLLDDLSELGEELGDHEKEINPFIKYEQHIVLNELTKNISIVHEVLCNENLINLKEVVDSYLLKMKDKILKHQNKISNYVNDIEIVFTIL